MLSAWERPIQDIFFLSIVCVKANVFAQFIIHGQNTQGFTLNGFTMLTPSHAGLIEMLTHDPKLYLLSESEWGFIRHESLHRQGIYCGRKKPTEAAIFGAN